MMELRLVLAALVLVPFVVIRLGRVRAVSRAAGDRPRGVDHRRRLNMAHPLHAHRLGREVHRLRHRRDRQRLGADLRRRAGDPVPSERAGEGPPARRRPARVRRRGRPHGPPSRGRLVGGRRHARHRRRLALLRGREPLHAASLPDDVAARDRGGLLRGGGDRAAPLRARPAAGRGAELADARLRRGARARQHGDRAHLLLPHARPLRRGSRLARHVPAAAVRALLRRRLPRRARDGQRGPRPRAHPRRRRARLRAPAPCAPGEPAPAAPRP